MEKSITYSSMERNITYSIIQINLSLKSIQQIDLLNAFQREINLYNRICNIPFHTRVSNTLLHMACIFSLSEKGGLDPRDHTHVCLEVAMALIEINLSSNSFSSMPSNKLGQIIYLSKIFENRKSSKTAFLNVTLRTCSQLRQKCTHR